MKNVDVRLIKNVLNSTPQKVKSEINFPALNKEIQKLRGTFEQLQLTGPNVDKYGK